MNNTIGIVLAAGKGTRMNSTRPKVLHQVCGRPMIYYPVDCLKQIGIKDIYIVIGYGGNEIKSFFSDFPDKKIKFITQKKLLGTADALKRVLDIVNIKKGSNIILLYGDFPLILPEILDKQLKYHCREKADCTIASVVTKDFSDYFDYGRVIRNSRKNIIEVLESDQLKSSVYNYKEINLGIYCFKYSDKFHSLLSKIQPSPKGEFYITNVINLLKEARLKIKAFELNAQNYLVGINTQSDVAKVNKIMRERLISKLMSKGVTFIDPDNTYIEDGVEIGGDSIIHPNAYIEKDVKIGKNCIVGPCSRLRGKTVLEDSVVIGNFVEINRSHIKNKVKIKHFSYIGDAIVEEKVNIGAGAITANYDSENKNQTVIKKSAFIGSSTVLIAPVTVGENSVTGAGAVIPSGKDVPKNVTVAGVPAKILKRNIVVKKNIK